MKRTKIIATLGPASDKPGILEAMIKSGVDLIRVNFSHGSAKDHEDRVIRARALAKKNGREMGVLADLQGPKIRISRFKNGFVDLKNEDAFILDARLPADSGDETQVGIGYKALINDVNPKDILLLDDGRIILEVQAVNTSQIVCRILVGGKLSDHKGINRQGGGLSAKFLTEKDKTDMQTAIQLEADYIAISFPRNSEDIVEAKSLVKQYGGRAGIIAKIERTEAVKDIDAIIRVSDGIMIARGDLGVEIGDAELPSVQKMIISKCRNLDKAVITATQMMESMITSTIPTRAEVFDVANAVMDGTDAIMLSAETATGLYPDKVIEAAVRIISGAERNRIMWTSKHRMEREFKRVDEAIAMAAMYTANHLNIKAIVCLTESGSTPLWMSRIRSGIPIYALSRHVSTERKMTLYRGVYPIHFDATQVKREDLNHSAINVLVDQGIVNNGDLVILTKGDYLGIHGSTNAMKIMTVGSLSS